MGHVGFHFKRLSAKKLESRHVFWNGECCAEWRAKVVVYVTLEGTPAAMWATLSEGTRSPATSAGCRRDWRRGWDCTRQSVNPAMTMTYASRRESVYPNLYPPRKPLPLARRQTRRTRTGAAAMTGVRFSEEQLRLLGPHTF